MHELRNSFENSVGAPRRDMAPNAPPLGPSAALSVDDPSRTLPPQWLNAPGGFLWWYVDLRNEEGDGLVLIWSFGLPFLPGYADASRRGQAQLPSTRPSLNIALYRKARPWFYLLREYAPQEVDWQVETRRWRFGRNEFQLLREGKTSILRAEIDCDVPGTTKRLQGSVQVEGPSLVTDLSGLSHEAMQTSAAQHLWTPLMTRARGSARFRYGDEATLEFSGRAYHDRNASPLPLHALGIDLWAWGRVSFSNEEWVYYLLWLEGAAQPQVHLMRMNAEGRCREIEGVEAECSPRRRARYGMPWWRELVLRRGGERLLSVRYRDRVDDGPFYLRFFTEAERGLMRGYGSAEMIIPERVDRGLERPLVRMRVHHGQAANSLWVPLFAGPSHDRLQRLLQHWRRGVGVSNLQGSR